MVKGCVERKALGECEKNPGWMIVMCAKTCNRCELLDPKRRCAPETMGLPNPVPNALKPGELDEVFIDLKRLWPTVHYLSRDPWVAYFPDFLKDSHIEALIRHTKDDMKRSTDQGEISAEGIQEKVVSTGRTSTNAWCMDECMDDPDVRSLTDQISNLTRVPWRNFESYQVLQYVKGQKYNTHHDEGPEAEDEPAGPRILTFFLYLSDVEEGGETEFDQLGLKVKPVKGAAILWPSVLSATPGKVDPRTTHAALPVIKGLKRAANTWIHLRDFHTPNLWGCTGSFE